MRVNFCACAQFAEMNPLWLGVDMLDLLPNFTSQNSEIIAKHFDNPAVVFINGWYKTEAI